MPTFRCAWLPAAFLLFVGVACDGTVGEISLPSPSPSAPAPTPSPSSPDADTTIVHSTEVPPLHPSVDDYGSTTLAIETSDGVEHRLAVLVADEADERTHGLMEVEALPAGTGMWFVGMPPRTRGFWMKNTLVPLSIAYADADGRIVDLRDMDPCTTQACPTYDSAGQYVAALEVPQGWFADIGIDVGDRIREVG